MVLLRREESSYFRVLKINIVTYSGIAWLIIMGSGFDDRIYSHFFTITVNRAAHSLNFFWTTSIWRASMKHLWLHWTVCESEFKSYVTTDCQSVSLSWNKAPILGLRPDFYYCQTVAGLLIWGALSDERTGLSFSIAAGPRRRSHSRVRVPWDLRPYFTVSDLRLPFFSPSTTRRVTVEVFDPASTRMNSLL
jgi:hypothetical protein